jgi:hypothetical protein
MPRKRKVTVYTVQTVMWEYNDEFNQREDYTYDESCDESYLEPLYRTGLPVPLQSFLSREKAEAHRRELERPARKGVNPFIYNGYGETMADFTTLPPQEFNEGLRFDRRGRPLDNLYDWWELNSDRWTDAQRDAVWEMLDHVRFYQVVPMAVELEE